MDLASKEEEYKKFIEFHQPQFEAMGLPEPLQRRAFAKLKFEDRDIGEKVQMVVSEDDGKMYMRALNDIKAE